ncbi:KLHL4 protein, partial [Polypterus senegalus]
MSVSGKKEFDVKQILKLRWRWFSHSSQSSAVSGGYIQQEGFEHRGTPVHNRLKSHSRDRSGLRKSSSPVHSILASGPGSTPARLASHSWHQQNILENLQGNDVLSKINSQENPSSEECKTGKEDVKFVSENHLEEYKKERLSMSSFSKMSSNCSDEYFQAMNHAEQAFRKMENYLQHKQLCDVLLIAGDHKIPAHRGTATVYVSTYKHGQQEGVEESKTKATPKLRSASPSSRYGLSETNLDQIGESTDSSGARSTTSSPAESEKGSEGAIVSADHLDSSPIGDHLKLERALKSAASITLREPGAAGTPATAESAASSMVQESKIELSELKVLLAELMQDIVTLGTQICTETPEVVETRRIFIQTLQTHELKCAP